MNRYQKVSFCVVRALSVGLVLYRIPALMFGLLLEPQSILLGIVRAAPVMIAGILLYFAAGPLAKLITWGISDD